MFSSDVDKSVKIHPKNAIKTKMHPLSVVMLIILILWSAILLFCLGWALMSTFKENFFDFRNNMLPVQFSVISEQAQKYFLDLNPSPKEPVFTKIKGSIISQQITRYITEASAFGEDSVREVQSSNKDYVVTWAAQDPYEFGLEETITIDDLKACGQARENALAEMKQRADEWRAQQGNAIKAAPTAAAASQPAVTDDDYNF